MRSKSFGFFLSALIFAVVFGLALKVSAAQTSEWLSTSGNHIYKPDGSVWVGRGANLHDTRSCGEGYDYNTGAPKYDNATGVNEVKRRIDVLVDQWKATFIRLDLESSRSQDSYSADANYRAKIKEIVDYIGTKPGVYVLVSIWNDTSLDANGWPTDSTSAILTKLAQDFYAYPYVLYGVSNEPESNHDGALDSQVWARMNSAVEAIRIAESSLGSNRHIVTVQGTRDWARDMSYYVSHPITAGGGVNIAYETHVYNPSSDFAALFVSPSRSIPVIIGEFGPNNDLALSSIVTLDDMQTLMDLAKANNIPHLAWTFHQWCPPNLIGNKPDMTFDANSDTTATDGIGMPIYPTDFGKLLINNLSTAQTGANNCAAPVSSSLVVHIPIVTYGGANYWADLQYNSSDSTLTVANAGIVSDMSPYSSCTASSLASDLKLHIPVVILNGLLYWLDLQYGGSVFVITGYGQN